MRRSEELIIRYYPEDEMKTPMHMSMGQEAIPVAVCHALGLEHQVFASYRSHAAFLAKTEDPEGFFAELYGKDCGTAQGKAGSMHVADPAKGYMCSSAIVASCLPVAVGAAFAHKRKGEGRVACVFFGDGAMDEGVFWESMNVACAMQLPVLFVCEDNGFAVHTPTHIRQGYKSITDVVRNFDCSVFQERTTDVEILYHLAQNSIESIKSTGKPVFLHLQCHRYLEHVGIYEDYDAGYRSKASASDWYDKDCLALQRQRLLDCAYTEAEIRTAEQAVEARIEQSIQAAKAAAFPPLADLYRGVFHEKN
ncbi:MAG: thiamine pyrophosphate-dependent dehydrogenase E1 component subunit alpha [Candidatus Tectimicrobiota bacterium]